MWTLTICLLALIAAFGGLLVLVTREIVKISEKSSQNATEVIVSVVERLIQPVVAPEPIQQIDVPGQTEMFNEPEWSRDWNESGTS